MSDILWYLTFLKILFGNCILKQTKIKVHNALLYKSVHYIMSLFIWSIIISSLTRYSHHITVTGVQEYYHIMHLHHIIWWYQDMQSHCSLRQPCCLMWAIFLSSRYGFNIVQWWFIVCLWPWAIPSQSESTSEADQ